MIILRRVYTTEGELCRGCLDRSFWHHTCATSRSSGRFHGVELVAAQRFVDELRQAA